MTSGDKGRKGKDERSEIEREGKRRGKLPCLTALLTSSFVSSLFLASNSAFVSFFTGSESFCLSFSSASFCSFSYF